MSQPPIPEDERDGLWFAVNYLWQPLFRPLRADYPKLGKTALAWVRWEYLDGEPRGHIRVFDPDQLLDAESDWHATDRLEAVVAGGEDPIRQFLGQLTADGMWSVMSPGVFDRSEQPAYTAYWYARVAADSDLAEPVALWLHHAAAEIAELAAAPTFDRLASEASRREVSGFGQRAVTSHVCSVLEREIGFSDQVWEQLVEWACGIAAMREEGRRASGSLLLLHDLESLDGEYVLRFPASHLPDLANSKQLTKLLNGVHAGSKNLMLVALIGGPVVGIIERPPSDAIRDHPVLEYVDGYCRLMYGGERLCEIRAGRLLPKGGFDPWAPVTAALEEVFSTGGIDGNLGGDLGVLVEEIQDRGSGFTIVIQRRAAPLARHGQPIEGDVWIGSDLGRAVASGLAKVDGALVVDARGRLRGFGVILGGKPVVDEDPSRGSRYNSALRYVRSVKSAVVVVGSADGPVTVMTERTRISSSPRDRGPFPLHRLLPLRRWLAARGWWPEQDAPTP